MTERNALINRKGTSELYIGSEDATEVKASDKLVNLGTIGAVGGTTGEVENSWLDTGKEKYPDEAEYNEISVEQNILTVEDEKLYGYFQNGTLFPFAYYVCKKDGTVLLGRKGMGSLASYEVDGNTIGDTMLAKYSIRPVGTMESTTTKPGVE